MQIAAIQKLTLLDFPGKTACTVFTPGCNFRCGYCHNPELVEPEKIKEITKNLILEETFFNFLDERRGLLDGVCVTGGEPALQKDLPEFLKKIRKRGFLVKLDTNGSNPEVLEKLFRQGLLDYVAMDVKASPQKYEEVVGMDAAKKVETAKKLIMQSGVDYEFRTTMVKELINKEEWKKILEFVRGAEKFFLQNFEGKQGCLDKKFNNYHGFSKQELEEMCEEAKDYVRECGVRT